MNGDAAMRLALDEAAIAEKCGDLPIGAAVLLGDDVVARRHEEVALRRDPTAHAALLAIGDAAARLGGWRLLDCLLVVTLEPCSMCVGAALSARVPRLAVGARDARAGACGSCFDLCADVRLNHEIEVEFLAPDGRSTRYAAVVAHALACIGAPADRDVDAT